VPRRERRWSPTGSESDRPRSSRSTLVALLLTAATLMALDHQGGALDPVRRAVGEALGPAEASVAALVRPVGAIPGWFTSRSSWQHDVARLQAENADLRHQVATAGYDRNRLAEYDRLTAAAAQAGRLLVPARVIALGPQQFFSRTVTIDAGSRAGVTPDLTVVNGDGLVGRVIRVTATTATVLLVMDAESVVGGRVGASMEIGFLSGRGVVGGDGRLDLELVDGAVVPARGDVVVTWGSNGGAPYVPGIPVGRVSKVYASLRDSSRRAVIEPFVDFTALDVVGVVVPSGTVSDRVLVGAGGLP
jgi:rod shape-determining protein MreC